MGLDQYLSGKKYYFTTAAEVDDEGYEIEEVRVKLGYWRKHSDLHGYIVQTFAEGVDECQEIDLALPQLEMLLEVVKQPKVNMPRTEGFFFGESSHDDEQIKDDIEQITKAIGFLSIALVKPDREIIRSVVYRASW